MRRLGTVLALLAALAVAPPAHGVPLSRSEARDSVDVARAAYDEARARVASLSEQDERVSANADIAEAEAARLADAVGNDGGGLRDAIGGFFGRTSDLDRAAEAAGDAESARDIADMVHNALVAQIAATDQARKDWERAERHRARVEAAYTAGQYADAALERAHFLASYGATGAQDRRNQRALRAWQDYLHALARAAVVPPPAGELVDPTDLPDGLKPARDARNELAPGIATSGSLTVISAEAVRAVGEAFRRVGLPDVPGATTPSAYACGGLVATAWAGPKLTPPVDAAGQYQQLRGIPASSVQTGDVVVLGSRKDGIAETGVYVGRNQVVLADPDTGVAGVRPLTRAVLGVRRVGLGPGQHSPAPAGGTCGVAVAEDTDTGGPFGLPVAPGGFTLTAGFGDAGGHWSSGAHTGLDFAAPIGTPVVAVGAGTVTIEHPGWAGNLVRIDHGGGVETLYAHLSRVDVTDGQVVAAGEQVGLVGDEGNTTGPHLHLEVRLDGVPYDPAPVLGLGTGDPCPATSDGTTLMRCDAAVAFRLMGAAYATDLGTSLCAVTATDVGVDLCGGAERSGSAQSAWLLQHGPAYGWTHPRGAEAWHFEYSGDRAR